ncbi:MAG: flagellar biosynthesis protein FlhB [Planctomycetota bacterium]|jgi:flagellar biosynthetic protein FlhB
MAEQAEKTEQPTARRLSRARTEGQVPQGQELPQIASLIVLVVMLAALGSGMMGWFTTQVEQGMSCDLSVFSDTGTLIKFFNSKIVSSILIVLPVFTALVVGSVISCVIVSGPSFSPKAIKFRLDALNPVAGFKKLVNAKAMVRLLLAIAKLLFVSLIVWQYLESKLESFAVLRWAWSPQILTLIAQLILGLMIRVCIALLVLGIADTWYQKWKYIQDMKMSKQEVKEERKSEEGAPEVKTRIRRLQLEMAMKRMIQEVPKADVVIVNPTHVAVAIRYDAMEMESPVVVAKGADHLAEKIREIARAYGVPILRRPELARTVYSTVEPGEPIPPDLYMAVAEVLALIYRLKKDKLSG